MLVACQPAPKKSTQESAYSHYYQIYDWFHFNLLQLDVLFQIICLARYLHINTPK